MLNGLPWKRTKIILSFLRLHPSTALTPDSFVDCEGYFISSQSALSVAHLFKLMSIVSVVPCNHLILCRPLLLPPSIFPSIRVSPSGLGERSQNTVTK